MIDLLLIGLRILQMNVFSNLEVHTCELKFRDTYDEFVYFVCNM